MPKQTIKIQGFHGGINSSADPRDIKPIESPVLVDVNIDSVGKLTTLGGVSITDENPDNTLAILANKGLFVMGSDRQLDGGLGDESIVFVYDTGGNNIDAKDSEGWKIGVISFGAAASPSYYSADGVLRVSDADFTAATPEANQWFGYIEDKRFDGLNATSGSVGWKSVDQNIATPSRGMCLISTPYPSGDNEGGEGAVNSAPSEYIDNANNTFIPKLLEGGAVNLRVGLQYQSLLNNTTALVSHAYQWADSRENPYPLIADNNLKVDIVSNRDHVRVGTNSNFENPEYKIDDESSLAFGLYITQTELDKLGEDGHLRMVTQPSNQDFDLQEWANWTFMPDQIEADCWNIFVLTNSNYKSIGADHQGWTSSWKHWDIFLYQAEGTSPNNDNTPGPQCVLSGPVLIENAEPDGFDPGLYTFHYTNIYDDSKQESLPFLFKDVESKVSTSQVDFNKINIIGGSVLFNFDAYVTPWSDKQRIERVDFSENRIDHDGHGFKTGQIVMFSDLSVVGGIFNRINYYVSSEDLVTDSFKVSTSLANAVLGNSISITGTDDTAANFQYYEMNPRVTGSRLYWKHEENDNYFLIGELDYIDNGFKWIPEQDTVIEELADTDSTGGYLLNKTAIAKELLPSSSNTIDSFKTTNGFSSETKSINASYKTAVVQGRRAYIGNVIQNSKTYPDRILKSQVNKFDTFPDGLGVLDVAIRDGESIVKLEAFADRILEFKEHSLYIINVSENVDFLEDTYRNKGCAFDYHVTKTDYGIAWFNIHGVYFYDGRSVSNLLEKDGMRLINESDWEAFITDGEDGSADDATMENAHIAYIPKKRQLLIKNENTDVFIYDFVLRAWTKGSSKITIATNMTNFALDSGQNLFYITDGDSDKALWVPSPTTSTGFVYQTPDIDFGEPGVRKKIYKVYVTYKSASDTNVRARYDTDGGTDFDLDFQTGDNYAEDNLQGTGSAWAIAELKPDTSSESNNIKSFQLKFYATGTVPTTFEINDITIIYRMKNVK